MKKLFLLTLTVLLAAPCFANKTYFAGIPLESVDPREGIEEQITDDKPTNVYQRAFGKNKKQDAQTAFTLTVQEAEATDVQELLDIFFWESTHERDAEGTYKKSQEVTYNNDTEGKLDAYTARTYYMGDENGQPETAVFELKRAKQVNEILRFYTFTFTQNLQGEDVSFGDLHGNVYTLSPKAYFEYMTRNYTQRWTEVLNDLILPVFNN